jgi:hypothetical protein
LANLDKRRFNLIDNKGRVIMPSNQASRSLYPGKKKYSLIILLLLCLLAMRFISARAETQKVTSSPPFWIKECLTCGQKVVYGDLVGLAIDSHGYLHFVYNSITDNTYTMTASYQDSNGWHTQIIDDACHSSSGRLLIQVDTNGYDHILYDCEADKIRYAYRDPSGWHDTNIFQTWDFDQPIGAQEVNASSLVLDSTGRPRGTVIATINRGEVLTYYIYLTGSGWQMSQVGAGDDGAVALDATDHAHAVYSTRVWDINRVLTDTYLSYAYLDGLVWNTEIVQAHHSGLDVAIAVDQSGKPRLFTDDGTYYVRNGTGWDHQTIHSGSNPLLLLDHQDHAFITSADWWGDIYYTYQQGSSWVSGAFGGMTMGGKQSMALDSDGNLHMAYRDNKTNDVIHVYPYTGVIYYSYLPFISR